MKLPKEILKQVKGLEISTRKVVTSSLAGEYKTHFKGQGMTFSEFREYVPGDDIRHISWPLTARAGRPFIKKFEEERELTMMLVMDISGSLNFGSGEKTKAWVATQVAALLAFAAKQNRDPVGLLMFTDQVEHMVLPGKNPGHVQRILRDILYLNPKSRGTDLNTALYRLNAFLRKRSVVVIVSDFLDQKFESNLRQLGKKHDVVGVLIDDPFDTGWPELGLLETQDLETGEQMLIDLQQAQMGSSWSRQQKESQAKRVRILKQAQVEPLILNTQEPVARSLKKFFAARKSR